MTYVSMDKIAEVSRLNVSHLYTVAKELKDIITVSDFDVEVLAHAYKMGWLKSLDILPMGVHIQVVEKILHKKPVRRESV